MLPNHGGLCRLTALLVFLLVIQQARAQEAEFNTLMMRATVKIEHEKSTAAGLVLWHPTAGKFVLITADHVLQKTPGDETKVVFRSVESDGVYQRHPTTIQIRKEGQPLWTKHTTQDIAAIWITPPAGMDLPRLTPDLLADDQMLTRCKVHPGSVVSCLGYPHREEGSKSGFALLRPGAIASFPLLPTNITKTFFLSCNTFEGDSGGPVYLVEPNPQAPGKEPQRCILGLIIAQQFIDEEMKMMYGTTTVRHRLGLAIVVHASFVKETIASLK